MLRIIFEMLMYGICFCFAVGISYIAGILKQKNSKVEAVALSIVVILIVCAFAGLRADTVGTDVRVYAKPVFENAGQYSLSTLAKFMPEIDYGFKLAAYLVARITDSLGVFLFVIQLFTFAPVYIVAYKRNAKAPIWLTVLIYLCIFFCATFNVMRQSMCAAMLLLAYTYFEEKKYIKTAICAAIAYSFHGTAIIGIAIYAMCYCTRIMKKAKWQKAFLAIVFFIAAFVFSQWDPILRRLIDFGIVPERYRAYLLIFGGQYTASQAYMVTVNLSNYIELAYRCAFALLGIIWGYKANIYQKTKNMSVYVNMTFVCAIVNLLTVLILNSSYGLRAVWNNEFILLLLFPHLMTSKNITPRYVNLRFLVIALVAVSYFLLGYILLGWHGVQPLRFTV